MKIKRRVMKIMQRSIITDIFTGRFTGRFTSIFIFTAGVMLQTVTASAGYDELKSEMERYQLPLTTPANTATQSASEKEVPDKMVILRQKIVKNIKNVGKRKAFLTLSSALEKGLEGDGVAKDGEQAVEATSRLLRANPDLQVFEGITLMRHAGIKAAGAKVEAQMNAFTQVENLDQILKRYSAFTEALMNGV